MADGGHSQGNGNGDGGAGAGDGGANGGAGAGNGDGGHQNPQGGGNGAPDFNPESLTQEQINAVLEKNPLIWKSDRIAGLREKAGKYDKAESDRQAAEAKALEDQGKFKELSEKQATEITDLKTKLQNSTVNQALTNKLAPLGVVDLDAALALVDRSKITVGDDGAITGLDEAIEALKTGKAYLFNTEGGGTNGGKPVGTPSNPGNGGGTSTTPTFKRSQLSDPKFYQEHRDDILKAQAEGKIEDDLGR